MRNEYSIKERKGLILFMSHILVAFFLTLFALSTWAEPPTYGAEFEVTRPGLVAFSPENDIAEDTNVKTAQMEFVAKMRERCLIAKCTITEVEASWDKDYIVKYEDGWWFKISYDPACVEFTFKPSTLEVLKEKQDLINDQIFKTAASLGLNPSTSSAGHFNIGVKSAFGTNAKKFLRFFVDYHNHDHLGFGTLGKDFYNAPPLSVLGKEQRQALQRLVEQVNSGQITSIEKVAQIIQDQVYTKSYFAPWGSPFHYQAIGLKYVYEANLAEQDVPMEIRAIRGQINAENFNLLAELFEARIKHLNKMDAPIIYIENEKIAYSPKELHSRFALYLAESGLKYENFKSLLPQQIQDAGFDSLLLKDAPIEQRLIGIEAYWDLIPVSELVRAQLVEVLSDSKSLNHKLRSQIIKKIQKIVQSNEELPKTFEFTSYLRKLLTPLSKTVDLSPKTIELFKDMLIKIEQATPAPANVRKSWFFNFNKPSAASNLNQCSALFAR